MCIRDRAITHTCNEAAALEFKREVEERYPYADVIMAPLSLSIACHIGPGCQMCIRDSGYADW